MAVVVDLVVCGGIAGDGMTAGHGLWGHTLPVAGLLGEGQWGNIGRGVIGLCWGLFCAAEIRSRNMGCFGAEIGG